MKAFIVKEDGLIYASEVPEKPDRAIHPSNRSENESPDYYQDIIRYEHELTSAKESAVLVSDQEKAIRLIYDSLNTDGKPIWDGWINMFKKSAVPKVYPIPDLQWERKGICCSPLPPNITSYCDCCPKYSQVAILKESPSTEQESQEAMWTQVINDARLYDGTPHNFIALRDHFKKQFTITRKP